MQLSLAQSRARTLPSPDIPGFHEYPGLSSTVARFSFPVFGIPRLAESRQEASFPLIVGTEKWEHNPILSHLSIFLLAFHIHRHHSRDDKWTFDEKSIERSRSRKPRLLR